MSEEREVGRLRTQGAVRDMLPLDAGAGKDVVFLLQPPE